MPYSLRACHPGFRHDSVGPIDPVDLVKSASVSVDKVCSRRENITGFYPSGRNADTLSRSGSAPPAAKSVA